MQSLHLLAVSSKSVPFLDLFSDQLPLLRHRKQLHPLSPSSAPPTGVIILAERREGLHEDTQDMQSLPQDAHASTQGV